VLMKSLEAAQLSDEEIHKVTWENACRWYNFDPFQHRSREASTVGALRAEAADVDTTPRDYGSGQAKSSTLEQNAIKFLHLDEQE